MFLDKKIFLLELTIPFETNLEAAHSRKSEKSMPLLSPTSALSLSTVRSFLLLRFDQEASSRSPTSTLLFPSFLQSRLFIRNAFAPTFTALLPCGLTLFSALGQIPPGFHRHFLSWLLPLDPFFFLLQDPLGDASPSFFSIPLFPLLVGYPFFRIFAFSPIFIIVQHAWRLTRGRICTQ